MTADLANVDAESVAELGTILSVWAHPDDETFLSGGLMSLAADNGQRVVCVSATAGEHGTDDPATWPPERLGRLRRWESAAAMAILGVGDHRWLGFEDSKLDGVPLDVGAGAVAALIEDVRPDTILTFGTDGITYHPDHTAVSEWTSMAWEQTGRTGRVLHASATVDHYERFGELYEEWEIYMSDERPVGVSNGDAMTRILLEGLALDRKLAALAAMHSQTAPAIAMIDPVEWAALNCEEVFVNHC